MLNEKTQQRMLAYTARVGAITPIEGADNIELISVLGWKCIAKKGEFHEGDMCVYFEIDSKVPAADWSAFLKAKGYKIKTMKLSKFGVISQGLALPIDAFDVDIPKEEYADCTALLGVTYAVAEDNQRKAANIDPKAKYVSMKTRHPKVFKTRFVKWMMKREWGRRIIFALFGKKKDTPKEWPVGKFPGVSKTDQERVENMTWVLDDKTPYIRTQKCDGSSGTFILARKGRRKFEFYVCSRNVRMADEKQTSFYGEHNYYWEVAKKYDIEAKMRQYLIDHPELTFICWQGEICAPSIQKNPQKLTETHLFCFHWTDDTGRWDIRRAAVEWKKMDMEVVPIDEQEYIMPDTLPELKATADGYYDASVCEGNDKCPREGYVYYKTTDPTFSFKNVSVKYLLKHDQ